MIFLVFLFINELFIADISSMPSTVLSYDIENVENYVYSTVEEVAETTTDDSKLVWEDQMKKHSDQKLCLLILNSNQTADYRPVEHKIDDGAPQNNKTVNDKYRELCMCMLKKGLQTMIKQFPYSVICKKYVDPTEKEEASTTSVTDASTTATTIQETTTNTANFTSENESTEGIAQDDTKVYENSESTKKAEEVTVPISKHEETKNESGILTDIKKFLFNAKKYEQTQIPAFMQFKSVVEPKANKSEETQDTSNTKPTSRPKNPMKIDEMKTRDMGNVYEYHPNTRANQSRIPNFKYYGAINKQDSKRTHFKNTDIDLAFGDLRNTTNTSNNENESRMKNVLTINGSPVMPESISNETKNMGEKIAQNSSSFISQFKIGINPARDPVSQDDLKAIEKDKNNTEEIKTFLQKSLPSNTSSKENYKEFCINMQRKGFDAFFKEYPYSIICAEFLTIGQENNNTEDEVSGDLATSKYTQESDIKINLDEGAISKMLELLTYTNNTSTTPEQTYKLSNANSRKEITSKGNIDQTKTSNDDKEKPIGKLSNNERADRAEKISIKERRSDSSQHYRSEEREEDGESTQNQKEVGMSEQINPTQNKQHKMEDSHIKTTQSKPKTIKSPSYIQKIPKKSKSEVEAQKYETDHLTILETSFTLALPDTTKSPKASHKSKIRRKRGLSEDIFSTAQANGKHSKKQLRRRANNTNIRRKKYYQSVNVETIETATTNSNAFYTTESATKEGIDFSTYSSTSEKSNSINSLIAPFLKPKTKIYYKNAPSSRKDNKGNIAIVMDLKNSNGAEGRIKMHINENFSLASLINASKQHLQHSNSPKKFRMDEHTRTTDADFSEAPANSPKKFRMDEHTRPTDADFSVVPAYARNNKMELVPLETENNERGCNIKCFGNLCEPSDPVCTYSDSDGRHFIHFDTAVQRSRMGNKTKNPVIFIVDKKTKEIIDDNEIEKFNNPERLPVGTDVDGIKLIYKGEDLINSPNGTVGEFESFEIIGTDDKRTDYTYIILGENGIKIKTNNKNEIPILLSQEVYDPHENVTKLHEDFQSDISDFNSINPDRYRGSLAIKGNDVTTHASTTSTEASILNNTKLITEQESVQKQGENGEKFEKELLNIAKYLANIFINGDVGQTFNAPLEEIINRTSIQTLAHILAAENSTEQSLTSTYITTTEKTDTDISFMNTISTKDPIISVLHYLRKMKNTKGNNSNTDVKSPTPSPKVARDSPNEYFIKENGVCGGDYSTEETAEKFHKKTYNNDYDESVFPYFDMTYEELKDSTAYGDLDDEILSSDSHIDKHIITEDMYFRDTDKSMQTNEFLSKSKPKKKSV